MNILLLSPYHSGSHQAWADGYVRFSGHDVRLLSLPGRLWKWRMAGGAVTLAQMFLESDFVPDVILATDMVDLATFLALTRRRTSGVPAVLYMHENQLTYPLPEDKKKGPMRRNLGVRERQYVLLNWKAQLVADVIYFNSAYHRDVWFEALPRFLRHYREFNGEETVEMLRAKSEVVPVGIDLKRLDQFRLVAERGDSVGAWLAQRAVIGKGGDVRDERPLILWNQRWEFDKNPKAFFDALRVMKAEGIDFRLALCGESFQQKPEHFFEAQTEFADELIHYGFADRETYGGLLWHADIVISTAIHEFFGISILEAIYTHTFPILPHRLSYPELIPDEWHGRCLYGNPHGLLDCLRWGLTHTEQARKCAQELAVTPEIYDWRRLAVQVDQKIVDLAY